MPATFSMFGIISGIALPAFSWFEKHEELQKEWSSQLNLSLQKQEDFSLATLGACRETTRG